MANHIISAEASDLDNQSVSMAAARAWARTAEGGSYLIRYEDAPLGSDPGSRCGFGDNELDELGRILEKRGLCLSANDRGLVAGSGR